MFPVEPALLVRSRAYVEEGLLFNETRSSMPNSSLSMLEIQLRSPPRLSDLSLIHMGRNVKDVSGTKCDRICAV